MIKTISLEEAVGTQLAHDITEIRPGEFKGLAFRKGHTVCDEDLCRLQRLGKNHLYLIDLEADEIHENEAAALLAGALAGAGIAWENNPREGKINLRAAWDGLLQVDVQALSAFNLVDEVMCATLHNHTLVKQGELVGGTRALPLVMQARGYPAGRGHRLTKWRGDRGSALTESPGRPGGHRQRSLSRPHPGPVRPHVNRQNRGPGIGGGSPFVLPG